MLRTISFVMLFCVFWGWQPLGSHAASTALVRAEWNLAVVVDCAPPMQLVWGKDVRLKSLERLLEIKLRTLPQRISAGLWLGQKGATGPAVKPDKAGNLRELSLSLNGCKLDPDLSHALSEAAKWLGKKGKGSLLLVTAGDEGSFPVLDLPLPKGDFYCHVVSLGKGSPKMRRLAGLGGGAFFEVKTPERLRRQMQAAWLTAITPTRLLVEAHDEANHAISVVFDLKRQGAYGERQGITGRRMQIRSGVYNFSWPSGNRIGPGEPPAKVKVVSGPNNLLRTGGKGLLEVVLQKGVEPEEAWNLRLARPSDGSVVEKWRSAPFKKELPAGKYLLSLPRAKMSWRLDLAAGGRIKVPVGLFCGLNVKIKGPFGDLRLAYEARAKGGIVLREVGHSGRTLKLPPGEYDLRIMTIPETKIEVSLHTGEEKMLALPVLGALLVEKPKQKGEAGFTVLDDKGRELAEGEAGLPLNLLPGAYSLKTKLSQENISFVVESGRVTSLAPLAKGL